MEAAVRSRDVPKDTADLKAQVLQQRLLLLNHSSKCTIAEDQVCPVSRHCGQFKVLWQHILVCKDNGCKVMHCLSSRYVLSHYAKCADLDCMICPRVRESAKRESSESSSSPNTPLKKPRSSYWWASETFVQFTKTVTVNTSDFINPSPSKNRSQNHSPFESSSHSPYSTGQPLSIEKLNHNMNQMSIAGQPTRRPEAPSFSRSSHSPPPLHTTHTIYANQGNRSSANALDLLASAAVGAGGGQSSFDKPAPRQRSNSGASTATAGSSHSAQSGYSYSDYSTSASASLAPSVATTATGTSTANGTSFHTRSSSASSALFAHLQPVPFGSVSPPPVGMNASSTSAAQGEECPTSYLSSFSSVCSYHGSGPASPYMSPRHSPVNTHKEERFRF